MKSTREILLFAADLIETKGWGRCTGEIVDGKHCALSAISYAASYKEPDRDVSRVNTSVAVRLLQDHLGVEWPHSSIVMWNDTRDSAEEVTRALRTVAASAHEGHTE